MREYESLKTVTLEEAKSLLIKLKGEELARLLISLSNLEEWRWVQDIYLKFLDDPDFWVAGAAVTGLGHLARVSGNLEKEKVLDALNYTAKMNQQLRGKVEDAISDINMFI